MLQLYVCPVCKKMVLVVQDGEGELTCHGKPMELMPEKSTDSGREKHLPVIEAVPGGIRVKIGSVPHPMVPEHYIKWVEVIGDDFLHTLTLKPGDTPEKEVSVSGKDPLSRIRKVRIFCNVHGVWAVKP